jgi:hypothetical protein
LQYLDSASFDRLLYRHSDAGLEHFFAFGRRPEAARFVVVERQLTDSLPGQRVEIAKLTGVIPQAVVKLSLWRTTARLRNKFFLWMNPWTG